MKQRKKGEKMLRQKQTRVTRMLMLLFMGMLSVIGFKNSVFAAELPTGVPDTIEIETSGSKGHYTYPSIRDLTEGAEVTYTSSDENVFVIGQDTDDEISQSGTITETLSNAHRLKNGFWNTWSMEIIGVHEGSATLTVTISENGEIKSGNYAVTVTKGVPHFTKLTPKKTTAGLYDDYASISIENVQPNCTITISCEKQKALKVGRKILKYDNYVTENTTYSAQKFKIKNKADDVDLFFCAMKKGTIKFTVSVLDQNGEILASKDYTLQAKAYENPFSSLKIGTKDFTRYFNHYKTVGDGTNGINKKQAKNTLGKPIAFKLKKGYRFEKITYLNKDEWEGMVKRSKLTVQKTGDTYKAVFPSQCWDMRIIYKDKKGKKKSVSFYYSTFVFQ